VEIVWKNMPLTTIHQNAMGAALAAEAAHNQGKFWEMHDKLFENQSKLEPGDVKQYAKELGLNLSQFDSDLQNSATKKRVSDDMAEASSLGITGTPAFFINGRYLNGAQPFESFANIINDELQRLKIPIPSAAAGK
jgi:protein-disulfide isomerase